jgi:hypothetical protein
VDVVVSVSGVVEADPFGQKKPCILKVTNDKVIAKSLVTAVYTLKRGDSVIASSKTATAQVIGEGVIKLNPATLVAPAVSPIDLWLYSNGVTVRIEFLAALAGDKARLIEINPAPGATPFPAVAFNANKRTNTVLSQDFLAARHGERPAFLWALIRDGKEVARSGPLVLNVNRIADGDSRFPTPVVAGQTGQELDVIKLVAGDKLSIASWLLQVAGQYVWLRYEGVKANGEAIYFDDLEGELHNSSQGLSRPALIDWLKTLKDDSVVTVTVKVNFHRLPDLATAVVFPVRKYMVKALRPILHEDFESVPDIEIGLGQQSIETPAMSIRVVSGNAKVSVGYMGTIGTDPGKVEGRVLYMAVDVGENKRLRAALEFKTAYSKVGFYYSGTNAPFSAYFYDVDDRLLDSKVLPVNSPINIANRVDFSGLNIKRIEVVPGYADNLIDAFRLDMFYFVV